MSIHCCCCFLVGYFEVVYIDNRDSYRYIVLLVCVFMVTDSLTSLSIASPDDIVVVAVVAE